MDLAAIVVVALIVVVVVVVIAAIVGVSVLDRADMVDEFVAAGKTMGIAEHNERRLKSEGQGAVKAAFEAALALT